MFFFLEESDSTTKIKKKKTTIKRSIFLKSLQQLIEEDWLNLKKKNIFLLPDHFFSFFTKTFKTSSNSPFSIWDLEEIINAYHNQIELKFGKQWPRVFYFLDEIFVNGTPQEFVLGEQGEILFRLNILFWQPSKYNTYKNIFWKNFFHPLVKFYPRSFFTYQFIKNSFKNHNFFLIYFLNEYTKAIQIKDGAIYKIEYLNFGISNFKQFLRENRLAYIQFLQDDFSGFQNNIVEQILNFTTNTIFNWFKTNFELSPASKIYFISSLTDNRRFNETINNISSKQQLGFILPFKESKKLETFDNVRKWGDIDILTAINALG